MPVLGGLTTVPLADSGSLTTVPLAGSGDLTTVPLGVWRGLTTVPLRDLVLERYRLPERYQAVPASGSQLPDDLAIAANRLPQRCAPRCESQSSVDRIITCSGWSADPSSPGI